MLTHRKVRAIFKSLRLILSLGTLLTLLLASGNSQKNTVKANQKLEPKKKDSHATFDQKTDHSSFLFVDCTGFFE